MSIFEKVFGTHSEKEIKRITPLVDKIEALDESMQALSNDELKAKTDEFKKRLADGETLDDLLVEAFAVVREASVRTLGMKHYPVQIMGGILLHQGRIPEMRTGEGKTLVSTLPAYLRDNMVIYKEQLVQRDLHYAIVDEVDSVLIDEARTPLIISGQSGKSTELYRMCDLLARRMKRGEGDGELSKMDAIMGNDIEENGDFLVNEKDKQVMLTSQGVKEVENFFHIENLADSDNLEIQHNIILALRAHNLMFRDKDYIVKDNEVLIVDEFTGRVMPGRRFSDGLHQAIEAKENVKVRRESKTLAK